MCVNSKPWEGTSTPDKRCWGALHLPFPLFTLSPLRSSLLPPQVSISLKKVLAYCRKIISQSEQKRFSGFSDLPREGPLQQQHLVQSGLTAASELHHRLLPAESFTASCLSFPRVYSLSLSLLFSFAPKFRSPLQAWICDPPPRFPVPDRLIRLGRLPPVPPTQQAQLLSSLWQSIPHHVVCPVQFRIGAPLLRRRFPSSLCPSLFLRSSLSLFFLLFYFFFFLLCLYSLSQISYFCLFPSLLSYCFCPLDRSILVEPYSIPHHGYRNLQDQGQEPRR